MEAGFRYWLLRIGIGVVLIILGLLIEYTLFKGEITLGVLSGLQWVWSLLFVTYTLSIWQTLLILSVAIICVLALSAVSPEGEADLSNYRTDTITGVRWRWRWNVLDEPTSVTPFCPNPQCDFQLELEIDYPNGSKVNCEECGFSHSWDKRPREVRDYVKKKIHKNLRSGEWT